MGCCLTQTVINGFQKRELTRDLRLTRSYGDFPSVCDSQVHSILLSFFSTMASLSEWLLQTDELTVALGLGLAAVFLLGSYLAPQSLVHPILLGRQSDVERVRKPGESAVYRNYGTGLSGRVSALFTLQKSRYLITSRVL